MKTITIQIDADSISDHVNDSGRLHIQSFGVDEPRMSFSWSNSRNTDPEVEYDMRIDSDLEYDFDLEECPEYLELQEDNVQLVQENNRLVDENKMLYAQIEQMAAEIAEKAHTINKLQAKQSMFSKWFSK